MSRATTTDMEKYLTGRQAAERSDLGVRLGASLGAIVLVFAAGLLIAPLNSIRKQTQLVLDEDTVRGLPVDIALLAKMGTLRGLAIDVAFIRLEELKEANRFYELMQLSEWLCKLAPRYPTVWQYSAWNMAYNISVSQHSPEARWLWVRNGIDVLRKKGIRFNPKSIGLYKELAWIYWHKVGDILDDFHWEYKKELAVSMELILGEPPLVLTEEEAISAFREITDAPKDLEKLIETDPDIADLVARLAAVDLTADESLLAFVARYVRPITGYREFVTAEGAIDTESPKLQAIAILEDAKNEAAVRRLLAALRSNVIRQELNMQPEWMLQLMEDYGPIDWRGPFAHSLYWATYGDMVTKGSLHIDENDSMNTVRFIFFSLENMCRRGRMVLEPDFDRPNRSFLQLLADPRFILHMHEAYLKYGEEQFGDDPDFIPGTAGRNYLSGHRNFLTRSVQQLYLEGGQENLELAKDLFFYLVDTDRTPLGDVKPRYVKPLEEFVLDSIFEAVDTQKGATTFISSLLVRSFKDLSDGDPASSVEHFKQAKKAWKYYMRDSDTDRTERRRLEDIEVMRRDAARDFMSLPVYSLLQKARLWRNLDTVTRKAIYDKVRPWVEKHCEVHEPPFDPAKVLPPPPGMEQHRVSPETPLKERERLDDRVSTGESQSDD